MIRTRAYIPRMQNVLQYWIAGPCITIVEINQPRTSTDVAGGVLNNLLIFQWVDPKGRVRVEYRVNPFGYASPGEPLRLSSIPTRSKLREKSLRTRTLGYGTFSPLETEGNRAIGTVEKSLRNAYPVRTVLYELAIKSHSSLSVSLSFLRFLSREMFPQRDQQNDLSSHRCRG